MKARQTSFTPKYKQKGESSKGAKDFAFVTLHRQQQQDNGGERESDGQQATTILLDPLEVAAVHYWSLKELVVDTQLSGCWRQ